MPASRGDRRLSQLQSWCDEVLLLLSSVQPRTIPVSINTCTVLVFTDGSWESDVAGLGAVLLDESSDWKWSGGSRSYDS